jgi:hypothetical protein
VWSEGFRDEPEPEQSLPSLVRHLQLPFRMCFKFADDIAAIIAAKQGGLPPCTAVVRKVELLTARICFFALSNVEVITRHAENIKER